MFGIPPFEESEKPRPKFKTLLQLHEEKQNVPKHTSAIEEYKELNEQLKVMKAEAIAKVRTVFEAGTKAIFNEFPELVSFSWNQYTPYFNDGELCEFNAYTKYPEIETTNGEGTERTLPLSKEIHLFLEVIEEEHLKDLFGDHAKVTITSEGATVEEYEHE